MIKLIKSYFFNKHYQKLLESKTESKPTAINTFSSVTIIGSGEHHPSATLREASLFFKKLDIDCHLFMTIKDKNDNGDNDINYISKEDCLWYGVPRQELLIKWLSHKTDLLISLFPQETPLHNYLVASSNSRLKSGIKMFEQMDFSLDFTLSDSMASKLSPIEQCKKIYSSISSIGVRPPIIELL